ncbi:MAG: hypothetical protein US52_C0048G0002 [candidate division WS6 bacterium GW2011_GWA2_37_6]|uniref:Glycosyltransferase 2-like domain-containing protein n=1 Tax=candidate division WS6 bacterium GW2011_GWA2_37_6 TaxID=1619087 RepID=A0A0G0JD94_9BACT|nr:MAG: hypothetical protein US52_C0048G0002 [candidate division WS6 bacterium GW2011_GWA2_37_6]
MHGSGEGGINMQPKVGIILINYKDYAKRFLADCRDSLRLIDYPKDKYVVYIVDNATSPETRAYLQEIYLIRHTLQK